MRIWHRFDLAAEYHPARDDDEDEEGELEDAEEIHAVNTKLGKKCVNNCNGNDDSNSDAALGPLGSFATGRIHDIFRENDTSRRYSNMPLLVHTLHLVNRKVW